MGIFSSKKNTEKAKAEPKVKAVALPSKKSVLSSSGLSEFSATLIRPRITEKASGLSEKESVYVFDISKRANKKDVIGAVKEIYHVEPIKVAILQVPAKQVFVRGKWGRRAGGKKAYVYLEKGTKIELI